MKLPRKPLAVVFDLDGTLIDSEALVKDAHFAACAELGVAMSDAQFLSLVGMHREANDLQLKGYYGDDFPLETFIGLTRAHVGDRVAPLKPGRRGWWRSSPTGPAVQAWHSRPHTASRRRSSITRPSGAPYARTGPR